MKIALVHDQLKEFGGAERVLVSLSKIFPKADIYTSFFDMEMLKKRAPEYKEWNIHASWFHKMPQFIKRLYSPLRFLAPLIWESFDFSAYDLVISSSGWYMSKGIITKPKTLHICYLHHQPRYLYYYETAVEWQKYSLVKIYAHIINFRLRIWDYLSSQRPDFFIANSEETKKRIDKFYRRDATVIYPPVSIPKRVGTWNIERGTKGYYLTVSRLTRAKHIDLLIQAANSQKFTLKIVGDGRDKEYLQKLAGPTVEFLENVTDSALSGLYQHAKAFLFAAIDEEFGIAPVEALGRGVPVIAYADGGLKETVQDGINGYLFYKLTEQALLERIKQFELLDKNRHLEMRKNARTSAENYTEEKFKERLLEFISSHARTA